MNLGFILAIIALFLFLGGLIYAILIYFRSLDRTYWEVVFGVLFTILGEMAATTAVLINYELFDRLWWIIPFPVVAFALTGIPMAVLQEIKHQVQKWKAERAEQRHNGE